MKTALEVITAGGIGVFPTDTLYGIVASALHKNAVERVFSVKGRRPDKPVIVLISDIKDLAQFSVNLTSMEEKIVQKLWPGRVSILLSVASDEFAYVHRGTHAIAFRVPANESLRTFLQASGPLIAPSANPEGKLPATTIEEARAYFGDHIDFYEDGGVLVGEPSTLIRLQNEEVEILRQGAGVIPQLPRM